MLKWIGAIVALAVAVPIVGAPASSAAAPVITRAQMEAAPDFRPVVRPLVPLTVEPDFVAGDWWGPPAISGDGNWVAYTDGPDENNASVWRINVATKERVKVSAGRAWGPDISADGRRVVYVDWTSSDWTVWLWEAGVGRRRLSQPGADVRSLYRPVQISDDGNVVVWQEQVGRDFITHRWRNGTVTSDVSGQYLTGDGRWMFGQDSRFRLFRYSTTSTSSSEARSRSLDFPAFGDDGSTYVGSGYSDELGWVSGFGRTGVGDVIIVNGPVLSATPVPARLSGDGSTMAVYGPDSTGPRYVIDTATRAVRRIAIPESIIDLSDNGRYALTMVDGTLSVADLATEAAPEVEIADLARPQLSDQMDRLYLAVFGRVPSDAEVAYWLRVRAGGTPLVDIAVEFTRAVEFRNRYGSLSNAAFVDLIYRNVLDRPPDTAGRNHWVGLLNNGMSRAELVVALSDSTEFIRRTQTAPPSSSTANQVWRLYKVYFLRGADQNGFDFWHQSRFGGASLDAISDQFAASAEFQTRYGSLTDAQFVNLVYRNVLERSPDGSGRTFWIGQLASGMSRGEMMVEFSESAEFLRRSDTLP